MLGDGPSGDGSSGDGSSGMDLPGMDPLGLDPLGMDSPRMDPLGMDPLEIDSEGWILRDRPSGDGSSTDGSPRDRFSGMDPRGRIFPGMDRSGSAGGRTPGRPLTLVKFIQTAGVAEGTDGSRLPAAPPLHPHGGLPWQRPRYMAASAAWKSERTEEQKKMSLFSSLRGSRVAALTVPPCT